MAMLTRKSRMVSFRLSDEQYNALIRICKYKKALGVSEFARTAVLERVQALAAPQFSFAGDLNTLEKTLDELDRSIVEASAKIQRLLGPGERRLAARAGSAGPSPVAHSQSEPNG